MRERLRVTGRVPRAARLAVSAGHSVSVNRCRVPLTWALTAATLALAACGSTSAGYPAASSPQRPATAATSKPATSKPVAGVPSSAPPPAPPPLGTPAATLALLPVKGRAPKTGYTRAQFGQAWADVDRNGCDTRNDILRRDLTRAALKADTHGCLVLTGTLADPYSGMSIAFRRGVATSAAVQIDHVVALSDAWQTGAQALTARVRVAFANDPANLLAVSGRLNEQKSDSDAASWLPPHKSYRCAYVARQVAVKQKYRLWVTPSERSAIASVLARCPGQRLPAAGAPVARD